MSSTSTVGNEHRSSTERSLSQPRSLPDEHLALLDEVRQRTDAALALIEARVWPAAETAALVRYLRTAVLRQASDEEVLLYPRGASAPVVDLSDDHVRLHELTDRLERVDSRSCSLLDLRALIELVLTVLKRHLASEQAVLAALADVPSGPPSTASAAATDSWQQPVTDEPVFIRLGPAPTDDAVNGCIERLLRLRPRERAVVRSGDDAALQHVCRWLHRFDTAAYGLEHERTNGRETELHVTRREPA